MKSAIETLQMQKQEDGEREREREREKWETTCNSDGGGVAAHLIDGAEPVTRAAAETAVLIRFL